MEESIKLYAVRNKKGFWFRAKGYGGHGNSWVESLNDAKLYTKEHGHDYNVGGSNQCFNTGATNDWNAISNARRSIRSIEMYFLQWKWICRT